jgi:hypothetical protein
VVTVPRRSADPSILWTRFARTLGGNPGVIRFLEGRRNTSLGWVEAEFLRRFNERAAHSIPWSKYPSTIIEHVVNNLLCQRPGALPVSLPAAERGWVTARADAMIAELAETGYHVIGDLEELRSAATDDLEVVPAVSDTQVLDAALNAIVAAVKDDTNQSAAPSGQSRSDFSEAVERERHNMSCLYPGYASETTIKPAE